VFGPLDEEHLQNMKTQGKLSRTTKISENKTDWRNADTLPFLFPTPPTKPPFWESLSISFVPRVKHMGQSILGKSQKLLVPLFTIGIVFLVLMFLWGVIIPPSNPIIEQLRKAKSGDWVEYEITESGLDGSSPPKTIVKIEVTSNDRRRVGLRITTTTSQLFGRENKEEANVEIDLSKSEEEMIWNMLEKGLADARLPISNMRNFRDSIKFEIKRGKKTRETLSIAGQSFRSTLTPYTIDVTIGNITISVRDIKEWTSRTAPVLGILKTEFRTTMPAPSGRMEAFSITIALTGFRKI